ncbi:unnamed protein product [Linum tenue]|uniref:Uncharacterized protein n=1 Tax=Linum tenue TaxID=586396 RepID=A0AAV0L847_9ROSI|nr:unnamed protein product [Linum tenue]
MAINREIAVCLLLIFLVMSRNHRFMCVEGRHLRRPGSSHHKHPTSVKNGGKVAAAGGSVERKMNYNVDDFRPTMRGHSPGVGHSINN